jgi:VanZ family protein
LKQISRKSFIWYHLPAILYGIGIFTLSAISGINAPDLGFDPQDKLYHILFYTPFGYFLGRSLSSQNYFTKVKEKYWIFAILFGVLYGISDEIHQYYVPGRTMSIWDAFADGLGICLGVYLYHYRSRIFSFFSPGDPK